MAIVLPAKIINNVNRNRQWQRQRRKQKSLLVVLAVGAALVVLLLVFFSLRTSTTTRWKRIGEGVGSQPQPQATMPSSTIPNNNNNNKAASSKREKTRQEGFSNKKKNHDHPYVDSSFHLSNRGPKDEHQEEEEEEEAARIIERSPPPPPHDVDDDDDECRGKERLVQILMDATGSSLSRENVTSSTSYSCRDLPTWKEIVDLYGSQPVIVRHQCGRAQRKLSSQLPRQRPRQPRVAGLYNTGTNALVKMLPFNLPQSMWAVLGPEQQHDDHDAPHANRSNSSTTLAPRNRKKQKKKTTYFDWDVPWGKHNPPNTFYNRGIYMPGQANVSIHDILPVVVVKDPYWWMQSTCRNRYGVQFLQQQGEGDRCPSLASSSSSENNEQPQSTVPISVHRTVRRKEYVQDYDSLLHLWTDFYSQYLLATTMQDDKKNVVDFPFVMVRFEDLLFHAPAVLQAIANCANGYDDDDHDDDSDSDASTTTTASTAKDNVESSTTKKKLFSYYLPKSKSHGKTTTDFVSAMIKYGTTRGRTNGMSPQDLQFARHHLQQPLTTGSSSSSSLMQILHYQPA
jgi:hypothetical protein